MIQCPCTLSKIIDEQRCLYKYPGDTDVGLSHMAQVCIHRFCAGHTQEYRSYDDPCSGMHSQDIPGIDRIDCFEDMPVVPHRYNPKDKQHGKPNQHNRPKGFTDFICSELLEGEESGEDDNDDRQYRY